MGLTAEHAWMVTSVLAHVIVSELVLAANPGLESVAMLSPGFAVLVVDEHSGLGVAG